MVATASAALVVVPLTGAAAVALVSQNPTTPDQDVVAVNGAEFAAEIQAAGTPVVAGVSASYSIDTPEIAVEALPAPVPVVRTAPAAARAVANSADIAQAIAGSAIIAEASKYVGYPYLGGGSSPDTGFDCSGFISYVYGQFGISVPRTSSAYFSFGTRVDSPLPGDIIVSPGHVGIYAGPNLQIDSPRPGKTIQFRPIWQTNPIYVRVS
jgi:cell wall-associated NlpC family hydrolase